MPSPIGRRTTMAPLSLIWGLITGVAATSHLQTAAGPKPGVLNVHLVPHTHDDVGWLKTVDQYYAGLNNSIQNANVKFILDSVVRSLAANPDRKFTYVEIAFFHRWWVQQDEATQTLVKRLVKDGQLQFVNGGWCMHDEATPHYIDMIDQTTTGHRLLMEEFGVSPKVGWQLDPFGHSATQAALLSAEVGFVGLFFGRIDYEDLDLRRKNKACEFVWRASPSLGKDAQVFSGLTGECGGNYGPPTGFDWDIFSSDEPIQDDERLHGHNVKSRVDEFVAAAQELANATRGEHIMFTMGSDFQYQAAENWYVNLDKIIHYANLDGRVNVFYSTPEAYVAAKASERSVTWPLKTDDFFPYADGPHMFWSGYSTSRPALKRFVRETSAFLQVARQVAALSGSTGKDLEPLARAMGVLQHHDAVAGTEKQHVAFDYAERLAAGRAAVEPAAKAALAELAKGEASMEFCWRRNVSVCHMTQSLGETAPSLEILVWNGLAQARSELLELPLDAAGARVVELAGGEVPSQVVPSLPSITSYGRPAGGAKSTLLFNADLPPLGFRAFRLEHVGKPAATSRAARASAAGPVVLENDFLRAEFCPTMGTLCRITDKTTGVTVKAHQTWLWYEGAVGSGSSVRGLGQASGAYIFRPNSSVAKPVGAGKAALEVARGPLADEVLQTFGPWVSQRVRLAKGARHLEITYTVGPIPIQDGVGKEVVTRISTDLENAGECYTDSNGRDMIRRQRDYRQSWKYNATDHGEPVAGNYYPVTTAIFMRDRRAQLTVLTDRAQSATGSVRDGELEIMVHRRLLKDDDRGVGEPLNETEAISPYVGKNQAKPLGPGLVVRGQHKLLVSTPEKAAATWRPEMDRVFQAPVPVFLAQGGRASPAAHYSGVAEALPDNVQLVSLEPLGEGKVMIRLAHQFGLGEDPELSKPATVDIARLFAAWRITGIEERGLTGTIPRAEVLQRRVAWSVEGDGSSAQERPRSQVPGGDSSTEVTLGPLQIRTFYVDVSAREILV